MSTYIWRLAIADGCAAPTVAVPPAPAATGTPPKLGSCSCFTCAEPPPPPAAAAAAPGSNSAVGTGSGNCRQWAGGGRGQHACRNLPPPNCTSTRVATAPAHGHGQALPGSHPSVHLPGAAHAARLPPPAAPARGLRQSARAAHPALLPAPALARSAAPAGPHLPHLRQKASTAGTHTQFVAGRRSYLSASRGCRLRHWNAPWMQLTPATRTSTHIRAAAHLATAAPSPSACP
jgi:hypothetical protein